MLGCGQWYTPRTTLYALGAKMLCQRMSKVSSVESKEKILIASGIQEARLNLRIYVMYKDRTP